MVAVLVVVLIGAAAFAVDAGQLWAAHRRLHTSTDAAALAAAESFAEGVDGCATVDDTYAHANDSEAVVTDCSHHANGRAGYVSVTAQRPVDFQFAGAIGIADGQVNSTTHAMYGFPTGANGVRPMGLCIDANPELTAWLNLPQGPTADSETIRIVYNKSQPDACGTDTPGNWGMLDFNGGANSNSEAKEWVLNGFPETVPMSTIPGDTGAFTPSIDGELALLLNTQFAIPIFDNVSGTGATATFQVVAFAWVKLVGFQTSGSEADRYLDLQFRVGQVIQGTCCGTGDVTDTGVRAVRICGTDPNPHETCASATG